MLFPKCFVYSQIINLIMKKLLILSLFLIISCSKDDNDIENPLLEPNYSIEDKWIWSPTESREHVNTMYEYMSGVRYTSYIDCWPNNCTDSDFNALDESDRIPGIHSYTWDGDTQTITDDEGNSSMVIFECDGGIVYFPNGSKLWRLSSNCQ